MANEKQLWEILVPCMMNNKPVRTRHHKEWDKYVRKISGGLTILTPGKGQWIDPGNLNLWEERMIPCRIYCTEAQIDMVINFTLKHYNQLAVMAYLVSNKIKLKFDPTKQNEHQRQQ
jgi:hypothetical protein